MQADRNFLRLIGELDGAVFSHTQWLKHLHRTLICQDAINGDDLAEDAHRRCKFGDWYYDSHNDFMRDQPDFLLIDELHRVMHDQARALLRTVADGRSVGSADYDRFIDAANHFKQQVRDVQFSLVGRVCLVDHLTGVWNRYAMNQQLARELERMQRTGHPCSLAMMDLDHFKRVNDTWGHRAGDAVLHQVVEFVSGCLRKYDSIARFGGEEFLLCLPNTDEHLAAVVLDRCREQISILPIDVGDGQQIHVSASFGIAAMRPEMTIEDTIHMADHALLAAKASGRNRVEVAQFS